MKGNFFEEIILVSWWRFLNVSYKNKKGAWAFGEVCTPRDSIYAKDSFIKYKSMVVRGEKIVSKGWSVGWPTTGTAWTTSSSISGEVEKTKRTLIRTRGVRSPSQPAVTPQMQPACISAAAAVVAVAAVVSSVSESVEPPRLRPVCSALLHPEQPQQKCLQPLCPPGAPVWGRVLSDAKLN